MQGQLFTQEFLASGIRQSDPYRALSDARLDEFAAGLRAVFAGVSVASVLNEAQTEQLLLVPVLAMLDWTEWMPQVNASGGGRESVPDLLLFPDAQSRGRALAERHDARRYRHGLVIVEAKRWRRALDRGDETDPLDPGAPSSQMLRYLSRVDVISDRAVKWGILTNGSLWRLYWQDARSRAEDFFEVDLAAVLGVPGTQSTLDDMDPRHGVKLFFLLFHRAAFLTQTWDTQARSFHGYALDEARHYEENVSRDLGARVFSDVFPQLANAIAHGDPAADRGPDGALSRNYLGQLQEATLVLLYRLLFVFYAEDRQLLPIRDARYQRYGIRTLRDEIRERRDRQEVLSSVQSTYWNRLRDLFAAISSGDDSTGLPAYNGGLFEPGRAPILERSRVADALLAPIVDALSRRTDVLRAWINYRDLSVSHLGGIYERLLEFSLIEENGDVVARPASFARKTSGSYYTHDDLVDLILRESVGRLIDERREKFAGLLKRYRKKASLTPPEWSALDSTDPASRILDLSVCDPAMGSGHFLVALVDHVADAVLEAMNEATQHVAEQPWSAHLIEAGRPWVSPLTARIAQIRRRILGAASAHRWTVTAEQLDDRHIVRRMILKKCVYGVDKNPMAVELAKVALWLHTFTVGAPLSFLDHHLRCGDSLHGERIDAVRRDMQALGVLFQDNELTRLEHSSRALAQVADLTDIDIAEARQSRSLSDQALADVAPIHALLDFWRALRWLVPGWPTNRIGKLKDDAARTALAELFSGRYNLVGIIARGCIDDRGGDIGAANALLDAARQLAGRERFFHWWSAFPNVFAAGGFDAVIGNPPWDRIKLQRVEWFAERRPAIAMQARASDRKKMIEALARDRDPLAAEYEEAADRAEAQARVFRDGGDFPLLSGGDTNLYGLFVERAQALAAPHGLAGLLTPSGIAADKGAADFFRSISGSGRLATLLDFENRNNPGGSYFADVDSRFKFCVLVFGATRRTFESASCAFYLHDVAELAVSDRVLQLTADDFRLVNPNTGSAPIFRNRRVAEITTRIYRDHPVLIDRSRGGEAKTWPVTYRRMFDMTNDSKLFIKREELVRDGWQSEGMNRWRNGSQEAAPLYVGKMIQHFDHRAADVTVNEDNLHNVASSGGLAPHEKVNPFRCATPQYWVPMSHIDQRSWVLAFRDIARATDVRTMIPAIVPLGGCGNTLPVVAFDPDDASATALLLANWASFAFDFVARQKIQTTHLNWYIVEQLPLIRPPAFQTALGGVPISDYVRSEVLRLSYTAWDLAPFARDLGYVDAQGHALPPFVWDEEDRRHRTARLDALFMRLYGLNKDDAAYILDTFPIVREKDVAAFGRYRTQDLVLAYMDRLATGDITGTVEG